MTEIPSDHPIDILHSAWNGKRTSNAQHITPIQLTHPGGHSEVSDQPSKN